MSDTYTMTTTDIAENRREQAAGLAAALVLHGLGLAFLWHFQLVPPPAKNLAVFVDVIIPTAAVKPVALPPPVPKSAPTRPAPPAMSHPRREPAIPSLASVPPTADVASPKHAVATPTTSATPSPPVVTSVAKPSPVATPAVPQPAPVQEAAPQQPLMLSGELSISCPDRTPPVYPKQSLRLREQGKTVLLVELDEKGHVARVSVQSGSGYPRLDEAAMAAVRNWRCSPARRHGAAVRSMATQPFNFTLQGR